MSRVWEPGSWTQLPQCRQVAKVPVTRQQGAGLPLTAEQLAGRSLVPGILTAAMCMLSDPLRLCQARGSGRTIEQL